MKVVQSADAKAHFSELLDEVAAGAALAISRQGRVIAHMIPTGMADRKARSGIVEAFRRERASWPESGVSIDEALGWRHEGHRY